MQLEQAPWRTSDKRFLQQKRFCSASTCACSLHGAAPWRWRWRWRLQLFSSLICLPSLTSLPHPGHECGGCGSSVRGSSSWPQPHDVDAPLPADVTGPFIVDVEAKSRSLAQLLTPALPRPASSRAPATDRSPALRRTKAAPRQQRAFLPPSGRPDCAACTLRRALAALALAVLPAVPRSPPVPLNCEPRSTTPPLGARLPACIGFGLNHRLPSGAFRTPPRLRPRRRSLRVPFHSSLRLRFPFSAPLSRHSTLRSRPSFFPSGPIPAFIFLPPSILPVRIIPCGTIPLASAALFFPFPFPFSLLSHGSPFLPCPLHSYKKEIAPPILPQPAGVPRQAEDRRARVWA